MTKEVCVFIFARGGSKGVPRKNLRQAGDRTLLDWSIDVALKIPDAAGIFVSTDDDEIASLATQRGVQVIRRGPELSGDNSAEWLAWQHAIHAVRDMGLTCEVFLSIPPTAPLRTPEDVRRCLDALVDEVDCVVTMTPSPHHPAFNMVSQDSRGHLRLGMSETPTITRRQDAPPMYLLTTVAYAARSDFVLQSSTMWQGIVRGIEVPGERALDVDSEWDLHIADLVLRERQSHG
jgi:CMP-N-acetylneuraminic acid synthetase